MDALTAAMPSNRGARPTTWVLTDGKPGMENQCLGLAEALGVEAVVKRIAPRPPWRWLPPLLWPAPLRAPGRGGDALAPPWPALLIATGRQTVAPAIAIGRASGGRTVTVQIQDPAVDPARFGLVVAPAHDRLEGANVVATVGALHRLTPERVADAAGRHRARLAHLPRPLVAVLLGGTNRRFRLSDAALDRLADGLARLCRDRGAGLVVTPSRRTGAAAVARLRRHLAGLSAEIWDGGGENPYFGYLGLADAVVVTGDSVSMVSEACATGKPVYVFDLDGGGAKFAAFHAELRARGLTRPFSGRLEHWRAEPLDDTALVATEIRRRFPRLWDAPEPARGD